MEILDIIILALVAVAGIIGIFKGFVNQITSIAALILGIWCASKFTGFLTGKVSGWFNLDIAQNTLHIITFIVIFIIVLILAHFLGKGIEGLIKLSLLGWLNRLLGFLFGAFKAIIILSIAVYAINYLNGMLNLIPNELLASSKGYGFLMHFTQNFFPFLHKIFS